MPDIVRIRCPQCGIINRMPLSRVKASEQPVCGRCKTPLTVDRHPVELTDASFAAEVNSSPIPVLIDLWAPWCGPCRAQAPVLDHLAAELAGQVRIAKLNVDENPQTAARLGASSIPLLVIFKDGREVDRLVGLQPQAALEARLARFI
jgi:thioredoxin 2